MTKAVTSMGRVLTIRETETIAAAAVKMGTNKVACLIITNENDKFTGLITEQDITRAVATAVDVQQITVAQIMTPDLISCPPGTKTSEVRKIMAANHIRHLPVVENGSVVDMFSIRDVLEQQLFEERAIVEQTAALLDCIKSMDINEVANTITTEVPKLFLARHCVLRLNRYQGSVLQQLLVSFNGCICSEEDLQLRKGADKLCDDCQFRYDNQVHICEKKGAEFPNVVIPLNTSEMKDDSSSRKNPLSGYLCVCDLDPSTVTNKDFIYYKAKLVRKIVSSHLANIKMYQQARLSSLLDPLTNVGSRRLFENKLEAELPRSKRYNRSFSIAVIDLDNFKQINDILGHIAGDNVLKKLAKCMKSSERTTDVLARYGGDEFVILMPETKAKKAFVLLERLRTKIQEVNFIKHIPVTISAGIAEWLPDSADSTSDVMRKADLALYNAKNSGRDCVKVWDINISASLTTGEFQEGNIEKLKERIASLSKQSGKLFIQSIWGLVQALEAKDPYTKRHSENVMYHSVGIAETMKIAPRLIEIIRRAAMIHDIGKIGIPDTILTKPGALTRCERNIIEQHPIIAARILSKMEFLKEEMLIVRHHHERWNGKGYPDGLSTASIPLGARIIAVADSFDAIASNRSYHKAKSVAEAIDILVDSSGCLYDPKVVRGMVKWIEKISRILARKVEQLTLDDFIKLQESLDRTSPAQSIAVPAAANSAN